MSHTCKMEQSDSEGTSQVPRFTERGSKNLLLMPSKQSPQNSRTMRFYNQMFPFRCSSLNTFSSMLHFHGNFSKSQEVSLANYQIRLKMNQGINNLMITFLSRKYPLSGVSLKGIQIPKFQLTFPRGPTPARGPS